MVSTILNNLLAFAISMPTNLVILFVICLIMKCLFKSSWMDCIRVIIGYILIGFLLSLFGITMPSFMAIGRWLINFTKSVW